METKKEFEGILEEIEQEFDRRINTQLKIMAGLGDDIYRSEEFKKQNKYRLGYNYELPQKCKNCPISDMCGGGCKQNYKEANRDYVCDILKPVIYYMIKKWRVKNAEL